LIPQPYGGKLVIRLATEKESKRLAEATDIPVLDTPLDQVYDAHKIAIGAYSPLEGFMGQEDYLSVIHRNRLSNDLPWTMPILLLPTLKGDMVVNASDEVAIPDLSGKPFALLKVEEVYRVNKSEFAQSVYGTVDNAHPNVADLVLMGDTAIGGRITAFRELELPAKSYELTPSQTREHFQKMGWKSVAAYQARNPPHLAHEYIQRVTLERDDVDALFIQPIVGKLKKGDYRTDVIMRAYSEFVTNYYPSGRVLLGSFSISMRYAGPKAVLFYAIVRRNYGCSHYIVGRDQAGVGSYYDPYAGHRIFDQYDVGVVPLRYHETFYCKKCATMVSEKTCPHSKEYRMSTSQTMIRQLIREGKELPREILRPEVAEILRSGQVINE
jgi:sulfate adenylyltransferase